MALIQLVDFGDTLVKGWGYFLSLGPEYPVRNLGIILLSMIAIRTRKEWFHGSMIVLFVAYQLFWIMRHFNRVG